jgi:hypothetical protein
MLRGVSSQKIGRNDPCPCGSGKKYKKCCHGLSYREIAMKLNFDHPKRKEITNTFFAVSDYLEEVQIAGACHLLSSILYVLLMEQGIDCDICIGEAAGFGSYFDHSWIEIDGKVYDVAIQLTLDERRNPPVFNGINLKTGQPTEIIYGVKYTGLIGDAKYIVFSQSFGQYMDNFPLFQKGAWQIVKQLADRLGIEVDIQELRKKYANVERKLVVNV